jgi:hypothetical protein
LKERTSLPVADRPYTLCGKGRIMFKEWLKPPPLQCLVYGGLWYHKAIIVSRVFVKNTPPRVIEQFMVESVLHSPAATGWNSAVSVSSSPSRARPRSPATLGAHPITFPGFGRLCLRRPASPSIDYALSRGITCFSLLGRLVLARPRACGQVIRSAL